MSEDRGYVQIDILGDSKVGKSCIYDLFIGNEFTDQYSPTNYVQMEYHNYDVENVTQLFHFFDHSGQCCTQKKDVLRFSINTHGCIIVFDVTNSKSFNTATSIIKWIKNSPNKAFLVLVGNKIDLVEERQVTKEEAENFATQNDVHYFETSAKNNENINDVLTYTTTQTYRIGVENKSFIHW